MKYAQLYQKLASYRAVESGFWQSLSDSIRTFKYEADEILLDIDQMPRRIYFVLSGGLLGYRWQDGKWILLRIWQQGDMILHIDQAFDLRKNDIRLVATECTTTLEVDSKEIQALRNHNEDMNYYFDQFTAEEIRFWRDQNFWRQSMTEARLRYADAIKKYGKIFINLTDKDKASYIGVSERWIMRLK